MQSIKCQAEALKEPVDDFKYSAGVFLPCLYSAGQLTRSPAEHKGCTVSPQSREGASPAIGGTGPSSRPALLAPKRGG